VSDIPYRTPPSDAFLQTGQAAGKVFPQSEYILIFKDQQQEEYRKQKAVHGLGRPLQVSDIPYHTPLSDAFLQTGQATGKVFPRSEYILIFIDHQQEEYRKQKAVYGLGRPLPVSDIPYNTLLSDAFLQTGKAAGKVFPQSEYILVF
jgi:hypothetical protein